MSASRLFIVVCCMLICVLSTCPRHAVWQMPPTPTSEGVAMYTVSTPCADRNQLHYRYMAVFMHGKWHRRQHLKTRGNLLYISELLIFRYLDCQMNPGPRTPKDQCVKCTEKVFVGTSELWHVTSAISSITLTVCRWRRLSTLL